MLHPHSSCLRPRALLPTSSRPKPDKSAAGPGAFPEESPTRKAAQGGHCPDHTGPPHPRSLTRSPLPLPRPFQARNAPTASSASSTTRRGRTTRSWLWPMSSARKRWPGGARAARRRSGGARGRPTWRLSEAFSRGSSSATTRGPSARPLGAPAAAARPGRPVPTGGPPGPHRPRQCRPASRAPGARRAYGADTAPAPRRVTGAPRAGSPPTRGPFLQGPAGSRAARPGRDRAGMKTPSGGLRGPCPRLPPPRWTRVPGHAPCSAAPSRPTRWTASWPCSPSSPTSPGSSSLSRDSRGPVRPWGSPESSSRPPHVLSQSCLATPPGWWPWSACIWAGPPCGAPFPLKMVRSLEEASFLTLCGAHGGTW